MARIRRTNRYCVDCGARLVYYPRLSNPKAPNEHRILVYQSHYCNPGMHKLMFYIHLVPLDLINVGSKLVWNHNQHNICWPF